MARVLVLYIVILISACAAPQLSLDEQGTFLFQDESFSISAPQGCMHNPSVRDSPNSVRFTARRGG